MNYLTPTKAIITDAGFASRFLPLTKTIPKAMLPLGNRPVIQHVIEECLTAGIQEIILVVSEESKAIYEHYFNDPALKAQRLLESQGKAERFEPVKRLLSFPKIHIIVQDPSLPYGNGSPIASAKPYINPDEAFIAMFSDDVVFGHSAVQELIEAFNAHPDAQAIIACQQVPHEEIKKYASADFNPETHVLNGLVEKPKPEEAASDLASYGRYLLTPEIFNYLLPENTGLDRELWIADAIAKLIPSGQVYVKQTSGTWMTTGDPKNYCFTSLKYSLDHEEYADEIRNFVNTH